MSRDLTVEDALHLTVENMRYTAFQEIISIFKKELHLLINFHQVW
jgi:hypothetical protein